MSSPAPPPLPQAGPSRSAFFPPPFRILNQSSDANYDPPSETRSYRASSSSRSSTPVLFPNGARFRSASVFSVAQRAEDEHRKQRQESVLRLRSTWDMLHEKYGKIALEDDDEVDLRTGKVIKDRGRLRDLDRREFGEVSESEDDEEGSSALGGPDLLAFEEDEDELGAWDERSGLDLQVANSEDYEEPARPKWTEEDDEDLREFLRAEAQRKRVVDSEEEVIRTPDKRRSSARSADEDYDDDISPRNRGTRILPARLEDLFLSDPEEGVEESSEDELQVIPDDESASDDATRCTPIATDFFQSARAESEHSGRRPRKALEVVIPIRSRSVVQPSSPSANLHSSPTRQRPRLKDLTHAALSRPASEPSLANLFDSPPRPAGPLSPSLARPHPPRTIVLSDSPSPPPRPSTLISLKGKEPMSGERPGDAAVSLASPSYCQRVWRKQNGSLHTCSRCIAAGGDRSEKAAWCTGRKGQCLFEFAPSTIGNIIEGPPETPSRLDVSARHPTSNESYKGALRTCRMCREAGGDRAAKSNSCKGRQSWRKCPFKRKESATASESEGDNGEVQSPSDDLESISSGDERAQRFRSQRQLASAVSAPQQSRISDEDEAEQNEPAKVKSVCNPRKSKSRIVLSDSDDLNSISESETYTPAPIRQVQVRRRTPRARSVSIAVSTSAITPERPANLSSTMYLDGHTWSVNGSPRSCKHCRSAGGERSERAYWCKGRSWGKYCMFISGNMAESDQRTPVPRKSAEKIADPILSTNRSRRKRVLHSPSEEDVLTLSDQSHLGIPPSPPPSSLPPSSPPLQLAQDESYSAIRQSTARSTSSISSLPPSSPPVPIYIPTSRRTGQPTPSPSVSAADTRPDNSPLTDEVYRRIAPLPVRTPFRPTPSPSIDGARSSSISSDYIPRKSALRQPSDFSVPRSSSSSIKRTRFSLQPRSPIREFSSDPLTDSQDQYQYQFQSQSQSQFGMDTSSPANPISSPVYSRYASSSSPLRNEWKVRAHDVGFKLGPEHTGRVPEGMVKALAPSLSTLTYRPTSTPTLASSLSLSTNTNTNQQKQKTKTKTNYALPTPPPSSSSGTASSNRPSISPANSNSNGRSLYKNDDTPTSGSGSGTGSGLMLPPPVPIRRASQSSRPPTPSSLVDESNETASTFTSTSQSPVSPPRIKFTSQPATYIRSRALSSSGSRSRSRSVSIAPSVSTSTFANRDRFTTPTAKANRSITREFSSAPTPRRKSRIERELARIARDTPDDAGLEWGLDEDVDDGGRMWREGSVVKLLV